MLSIHKSISTIGVGAAIFWPRGPGKYSSFSPRLCVGCDRRRPAQAHWFGWADFGGPNTFPTLEEKATNLAQLLFMIKSAAGSATSDEQDKVEHLSVHTLT